MIKQYILNWLLHIDMGINTLIGGSPYETISSRVGKQADKNVPWACSFCKILATLLGPQHCQNSEVPDYDKTLVWWKKIW